MMTMVESRTAPARIWTPRPAASGNRADLGSGPPAHCRWITAACAATGAACARQSARAPKTGATGDSARAPHQRQLPLIDVQFGRGALADLADHREPHLPLERHVGEALGGELERPRAGARGDDLGD